jgi:hypothetical protein
MAAPAAADPRQPSADRVGVYRPRRPRVSPLYRLFERHFRELGLVWDERFASAFALVCAQWATSRGNGTKKHPGRGGLSLCSAGTGAGVPANPVALERMTSDPLIEQVTYRSDKAEGPTAGTERVDPLEFLARLVTHIPDPGQAR